MKNLNQEIYASLEIRKNHLNFIVVHYFNSEFNVLYSKSLKGDFSNDSGMIKNPKSVAKKLQIIVKEASNDIGLHIQNLCVILPNSNLKIIKHVNTNTFKEPKKLEKMDIENVKKYDNNVFIPKDEIICFSKAYAFLVDDNINTKQIKPPLGKTVKSLTVKELIYLIKKESFFSNREVLQNAKLNFLSMMPRSYALGWSTGLTYWKNQLVIIDWGIDTLEINVFIKESLCKYKIFPQFGLNIIINELCKKFNFDKKTANRYLFEILNFQDNMDNKNLIIYNNKNNNYKTKLTMNELQEIFKEYVEKIISKINQYLDYIFNTKKEINEYNIICTGEILNITDFKKFMNDLSKYNIKFYIPNIIGIKSVWCVSLIGNIYYQHVMNKVNNNFITSIN